MQTPSPNTTVAQNIARILLGIFMLLAGIGHCTFQRQEFQAQVPDWVPMSKDLVVVLSGIVEIMLGLAMVFWRSRRVEVGITLAIFYILVFPGNIAQYVNNIDAFGLDTEEKRFARLFFQPVLVVWALWSTGAWPAVKRLVISKSR
ncbi:DoxX family protein [Dawidia soli]|uniref:DoxX family membrane protein n=1 Tax=Dawidia soli TaxID=2782352 RepID=A0AAP2GFS7_9BACT|nr:DoxX family membrane protein [Dawidia soli]MBT1689779.1 DoxX family membrane protein [Dawidia soli]